MPPGARTNATSVALLDSALRSIPGVEIELSAPMSSHTTMRVGGPTDASIVAETPEALARVVAALRESGSRWMMLGGGSNTLFADEGYEGAVVRLGRGFRRIELESPTVVRAGAAATLSFILKFARRAGLSGIEFGVGIPGNLGGALAGNAGAGGEDICSIAESVDALDDAGEIVRLHRGDFDFGYRWSSLRDRVILGARLRLMLAPGGAIDARIEAHRAKRREQPLKESSSGCMFENPPGDAAGRLIDRCGLKGLRVGGIEVSPIHANFMTNTGGGTTSDVLRLMELVRTQVLQQTGVDLESEVRVVPVRESP
jgi:UDP-N-acetylmuramate dehydrogenase